MSSPILNLAAAAPETVKVAPKPSVPSSLEVTPKSPEHHHAAAPPVSTTPLTASTLSSTDVAYIQSLLGTLPAQKMEELLLKTGIPIPVNLGPTVDTTA